MFKKLFTGAAAGWWGRRVLEWIGLGGSAIGGVFAFYNSMPPAFRQIVDRVLEGNWENITLGAAVPFVVYVITQVFSFRATTKPQVVTTEGTKVSLDKVADVAPQAAVKAEQAAETAAAQRGPILERLSNWLRR